MNERKLLELAAKAAGYRIKVWKESGPVCWVNDEPWIWNPLHDDGDALLLAVKLAVVVDCAAATVVAPGGRCFRWHDELCDTAALVRRAIVLAAAEIGKDKPCCEGDCPYYGQPRTTSCACSRA